MKLLTYHTHQQSFLNFSGVSITPKQIPNLVPYSSIRFLIFFPAIFFLFKTIYNWKTYFINYKLQKKIKNKKKYKKLLPPILLIPLVTENQLLSPTPLAYPYPSPTRRLNQIKCQTFLVFKTFSTCCHFL